ncbi:MAG: PorP/SprF family type IX secretion system membrane protein [Taibaiella sp.]|nr:PorP/SprF family type IX secretion system membrane protein [Taibaiella sp.]
MMNTKNIISRLSFATAMMLGAATTFAQDIHFSQFDMAPLVVNPAFTGMFDGQARVGGIYRDQWRSVTVPYVTFGAHADMPLYVDNSGGYLAGGIQVFNDKAGDGNFQNFSGLLSVAYHKMLGRGDLAVGLQGGYAQKSIDLSRLYFGDEAINGTFANGTSAEWNLGIGNSVSYYLVNAGVSYAGAPSDNFNYVIGVAANNINQPNDALLKKQTSTVGLDMRITGQAGLSIRTNERFFLRPAVLYQTQSSASEIVAGNEFLYHVGNEPGFTNFSTAVFMGLWYRTTDAAIISAGVEFKGVRIGLAYDYNISTLNSASNGNGGFEIAVRYIAPYPMKFAGKRVIPCTRF